MLYIVAQPRGGRQAREAAIIDSTRCARPAVFQEHARQNWLQAEQMVLDLDFSAMMFFVSLRKNVDAAWMYWYCRC